MRIREATVSDIPEMQIVRHSVTENVLSDPSVVPDSAYIEYLTDRGKGWVASDKSMILGFAIVDLRDENVWALFMLPKFEGKGIGRSLHNTMLDFYFDTGKTTLWLGTEPGTRAERFYRKAGWRETGVHGKGEIKFEISKSTWLKIKQKQL